MITLAAIDGRLPAEVDPVWEQGGLAIHHGIDGDGDVAVWFTVTHVNSGWAVRQLIDTEEKAIALAVNLLACGDWTRNTQELYGDRAFFKAVRQCVFGHGYHLRYTARNVERRRKQLAAMPPFTPTFPGEEVWP